MTAAVLICLACAGVLSLLAIVSLQVWLVVGWLVYRAWEWVT